jgi:hypothetical protein
MLCFQKIFIQSAILRCPPLPVGNVRSKVSSRNYSRLILSKVDGLARWQTGFTARTRAQ